MLPVGGTADRIVLMHWGCNDEPRPRKNGRPCSADAGSDVERDETAP